MPAARRFKPLSQLERSTPLVAIAAARTVVEELSLWLGTSLPTGYARRLAVCAHVAYAHSPTFRRGFRRRADRGRERLHTYLRHWLADILHEERPDLFRRLPSEYCTGEPLPPRSERITASTHLTPDLAFEHSSLAPLSPAARQLFDL